MSNEKAQGVYTVEKMRKTASVAATADGLSMSGNNFKLGCFQACPDMVLHACDRIEQLESEIQKLRAGL